MKAEVHIFHLSHKDMLNVAFVFKLLTASVKRLFTLSAEFITFCQLFTHFSPV